MSSTRKLPSLSIQLTRFWLKEFLKPLGMSMNDLAEHLLLPSELRRS
jgi:hypothetical protein